MSRSTDFIGLERCDLTIHEQAILTHLKPFPVLLYLIVVGLSNQVFFCVFSVKRLLHHSIGRCRCRITRATATRMTSSPPAAIPVNFSPFVVSLGSNTCRLSSFGFGLECKRYSRRHFWHADFPHLREKYFLFCRFK